jgi:L-serine deaminase
LMPIHADWLDERKTIILWTFPKHWTLDEFTQTYSKTSAMCATVPHWVNAIIDLRASVPPRAILSAVTSHAHTDPKNYDMAVVVTDNRVVAGLADILTKVPLTKSKFKIVTSLEEALDFCNERQKTLLNNLPPC